MAENDLLDSLLSMSSSLSSVPSDFEEIRADTEESKRRLLIYKPQFPSDDTPRVLESFVDNLPLDGKRIITKFIATCDDEKDLFDLSNRLCTAILTPSRVKFHDFSCFSLATPC